MSKKKKKKGNVIKKLPNVQVDSFQFSFLNDNFRIGTELCAMQRVILPPLLIFLGSFPCIKRECPKVTVGLYVHRIKHKYKRKSTDSFYYRSDVFKYLAKSRGKWVVTSPQCLLISWFKSSFKNKSPCKTSLWKKYSKWLTLKVLVT